MRPSRFPASLALILGALALLITTTSQSDARGHGGGGRGGHGGHGGHARSFHAGPSFRVYSGPRVIHHHRTRPVYIYNTGCGWLRERALVTGSSYWWRRYRACIGYY